jgi:hypothetical protein
MLYNTAPASLAPPGGKGPLWWIPGGTVDLMDGLRMMGTYQVDANGFLVPQNNAGENFTSATLTVGQAWTATLEPFVPAVQPGQDVQQRLRKRRIARFEVYVQNSTGFTMCRLFGGPVTRTSPVVGTIMQRRRIEAWNQDDDPTLTPPLREQAYSERPIGRFHDPRVAIIKDTPGPLTILELEFRGDAYDRARSEYAVRRREVFRRLSGGEGASRPALGRDRALQGIADDQPRSGDVRGAGARGQALRHHGAAHGHADRLCRDDDLHASALRARQKRDRRHPFHASRSSQGAASGCA